MLERDKNQKGDEMDSIYISQNFAVRETGRPEREEKVAEPNNLSTVISKICLQRKITVSFIIGTSINARHLPKGKLIITADEGRKESYAVPKKTAAAKFVVNGNLPEILSIGLLFRKPDDPLVERGTVWINPKKEKGGVTKAWIVLNVSAKDKPTIYAEAVEEAKEAIRTEILNKLK